MAEPMGQGHYFLVKVCKKQEAKILVQDTAHDCPVLRTGVACEKSAPEICTTLQKGVIQLSYAAFPHTTRPPSSATFYSGRCLRKKH